MSEKQEERDVIIAKILRFDPATDEEPHFETYEVPKYEVGRQTVAKVLEYIFENIEHGNGDVPCQKYMPLQAEYVVHQGSGG